MLHLYRDLLAARRASPALRRGTVRLRDAPEDVLAYERVSGEDRRLVLVNFGDQPVDVPLPEPWQVEVASARAARRRVATAARRGAAPTVALEPPVAMPPEHRVWRELSAGHRPIVRVADRKGRRRG